MKLCWLTDVHFDFLDPKDSPFDFGQIIHRGIDCDAAVITGDIGDSNSFAEALKEFAEGLKKPVYFVLGNHDYYGSDFKSTRNKALKLHSEDNHLVWLDEAEVIKLSHDTALVGHEGWYDAHFGDPVNTRVWMQDFSLIEDFRVLDYKSDIIDSLRQLGQAAADFIRPSVHEALSQYKFVFFASHYPPFRESCWHRGEISNDEWLPYFTCKAMGEMLLEAAKTYPGSEITVLCGHTHGEGYVKMRDNLEVYTGKAKYGRPDIAGMFVI